jgi:hypothetical protein
MSVIASRCQIPPDYAFALKEMATNLSQRTLQVGKARHDIGEENIHNYRPIATPNTQPETTQLPMPRVRRMTEASPRPILSPPFSNDIVVRGMPLSPLAQISRPAHSEENKVEPVIGPVLSLTDSVVQHACVEGSTGHVVSSVAKGPEPPPAQLLQRSDPCRLPEESQHVAVECNSMPAHRPAESKEAQRSYASSPLEQNEAQVYPSGGAAQKTTTPPPASDQSPSPPILSHEFSRPVTEDTKMIMRSISVPPSPGVQNNLQPATNGNFTVERKHIDRSPSHEKMWVDPSKFDERRPSHTDFHTLLDLRRPNLATGERKPSFTAPTYDEALRLDQEQTNSTRSPALSSEGTGSLPWTPHVERENYPELAPLQTNHSNRSFPRRVDVIDPDSFPEPLSTLKVKGTGTASIVSGDSEPNRFVSTSITSKSKKWGGFFKSNRTATATSIPHAVFSTSGKSLVLWNEFGAGCYDLHNAGSIQFRRINAHDVRLAAGGAAYLAVVTKTGIVNFSKPDVFLVSILTTWARATEWKCLKDLVMPLYETGDSTAFQTRWRFRETTITSLSSTLAVCTFTI